MRKFGLAAMFCAGVALAGCASTKGDSGTVADARDISALPPPLPPRPPVLSPQPALDAGQSGNAGYASGKQESRIARPRLGYVPPVIIARPQGREQYDGKEVSPVKRASDEPVSTFSVDVDTGAYANTRRFLSAGRMPPRDGVRTEEMINYFRYDYARPDGQDMPFTVAADIAQTPWNENTRLMRIGLRGYDLPRNSRPPANLVFLLDVSGSMNSADKLPLVKTALSQFAGELSSGDTVSIVVYAGAAGLVLEPTSDTRKIRNALESLSAGGSTAGGAGLKLAYQVAEDNFIKNGVNRVILATDGDFNVGVSDTKSLIELIENKRDTGITLTALGFGTGNFNEAMMEQVADHGNGNYAYIDNALEARKVLSDEMQSTLFTIAKDVKIQVEFNPAVVSEYRLIGYENRALREEDFNNDAVDAGDIGAGHQVTAIYEIVPAGSKGWLPDRRYDDPLPDTVRTRSAEAAHIKLRYKLPDGKTSRLTDLVVRSADLQSPPPMRPDFAFATSVAAFGQKLRADPMLQQFSYRDIEKLAGSQTDFWRQEFLRLNDLAAAMAGS
ncbi:MAG: vWA domain-containing protein [Sphingomonadaceae bacterium]